MTSSERTAAASTLATAKKKKRTARTKLNANVKPLPFCCHFFPINASKYLCDFSPLLVSVRDAYAVRDPAYIFQPRWMCWHEQMEKARPSGKCIASVCSPLMFAPFALSTYGGAHLSPFFFAIDVTIRCDNSNSRQHHKLWIVLKEVYLCGAASAS